MRATEFITVHSSGRVGHYWGDQDGPIVDLDEIIWDDDDDKAKRHTQTEQGTNAKEKKRAKKPRNFPRPRELWHTPEGEPWATLDDYQHLPVKSKSDAFREWIAGRVYENGEPPASRTDLDRVIDAYAAEARHSGPEHQIHLRFAREADGNGGQVIWLDLADKQGRAVRVDAERWDVVAPPHVPVKFRRPPNMKALPEPLRAEADVSLLSELLNLRDESTQRLVATWLSFGLIPNQEYPVIAVSGPPGSAKSSLSRTLRNLIDPSAVPLVGVPRGTDLVAIARNNAVLGFDNLSRMTPDLADDLCRLATGAGLGGRKFYTESDDATFNASRPIILNGISEVATRGDLADRSLLVRLPKIEEHERLTAAELDEAFAYAHPRILAGLLDMAVTGLRRMEVVKRGRPVLPRMADFALWGRAVAPALGWDAEDFDHAYRANRKIAFTAAIEDDPVAPQLIDFLRRQANQTWEGTTSQLWERLVERFKNSLPIGFPGSPAVFGKSLNRIEPALASAGVGIERPPHSRVGSRLKLSMA